MDVCFNKAFLEPRGFVVDAGVVRISIQNMNETTSIDIFSSSQYIGFAVATLLRLDLKPWFEVLQASQPSPASTWCASSKGSFADMSLSRS